MREEIAWQKSYDVHFESRQRIGAKSRFFVTKLRFTPRATTLAYGRGFLQRYIPLMEPSMSRRLIALVFVAVASLVVSACGSSPTAPRNDCPLVTAGVGRFFLIACDCLRPH